MIGSGCIHIDFGNPFKDKEPEPTEFQIITKEGFPIYYKFDIYEDPELKYSKTQPFYIPKGTEWINISIIVVFESYEYMNLSIINLSSLERYVHITVTNPENEIIYGEKFMESVELLRSPMPPTPGPWIVGIEAKGMGYEDTYDYFEINVVTYEPV